MDAIRLKFWLTLTYEDRSIYRFQMPMDWLLDESQPLVVGEYEEGDPYLGMFEFDFVQSEVGSIMMRNHGKITKAQIEKAE